MYFNYGMILSAMVYSILSAMESDFKREKKYLFWKWSFYFSINIFILSFVKYFLGYHKENLIESFWNAKGITVVHYAVPLIVVAVVLPLILKFLFREKCLQIIRYFDSTLFLVLCITFFLVRKINNKIYCISFLMALLISVAAIILKRIEAEYVTDLDKGSMRQKMTEMLMVLLYYLVTVVIYTPNELYLNNATDFPMSYWYFFGKLLLSGICVTVILMIGMIVYLNLGQLKVLLTVMFALLTTGYLQGLFLNGNMGVLDGTLGNEYGNVKILINLVIWGVLVAAVLVLSWRRYAIFQKIMKLVSIWIILIQVVTLGTMLVTSKETAPKSEMVLTTDGMLEVGEKNNIIVFILDKFDGRHVEEILEDESDFFQPLNDFVFYKNAASAFCPTYDSIPFMLSGTGYDEESHVDYVKYAYEGENLLTDMDNAQYDIGVYTNKRYVEENMKEIVSNYKDGVQRTCSMGDLFSLMVQCSMYKMAPFAAKEYYIYDTSDIALLVVNDDIVNIEDDLPFYHKLVNNGLEVSGADTEGTFRFIHMHGGHPPYTMTEDFQYLEYDSRRDQHWGSGVSQRKGAMKIVYEYIRQLKELGKYDDALIVITSDHGITDALSDSDGEMTEISYPILFVKEPNEVHDDMVVSNAPVCHADMIATIRKTIGADILDRALNEIGADEERTRYMNISTPGLFEKYEINGAVDEIQNWRLVYTENKVLESTH